MPCPGCPFHVEEERRTHSTPWLGLLGSGPCNSGEVVPSVIHALQGDTEVPILKGQKDGKIDAMGNPVLFFCFPFFVFFFVCFFVFLFLVPNCLLIKSKIFKPKVDLALGVGGLGREYLTGTGPSS